MRPSYQTIVLVALCTTLGFGIATLVSSPTAEAQLTAPVTTPRFQISAFSSTLGTNVIHGAYAIDTMSGKVWHVRAGGPSQVVEQKLE